MGCEDGSDWRLGSCRPAHRRPRNASGPALVLRWCDPHGLFGNTKAVGKRLDGIFGAIGVELSWKKCTPGSESGRPEIRVVLVHSEASGWDLDAEAMGANLSRSGPQSQVYIFYNSVVRALGHSPKTLSDRWLSARETRELSRGLARVTAHEVMHAVLPELPHAEDGLTHSELDRDALLDGEARIDEAVAKAFQAALVKE
ncbi:MAG TPA: hypothetical protein VLK65_03240 [Vicinamibacteria bacterium]|nr:hypothetical protein [Vicinamibacteria bacterium]